MKRYYRRVLWLSLPSIALFFVIYCLPYFKTIPYAFYAKAFDQELVGFANFKTLFGNRNFLLAIQNTGIQIALYVPALLCAALALTYLFEHTALKRFSFIRPLLVLPLFVPTVTLVSIFRPVIQATMLLSPDGVEPLFYLMALYVYQNIGFSFIILFTAIKRLPASIAEAAMMEGATSRRIFFSIQAPHMVPQLLFCFLLATMQVFQNFQANYLLYGSYPNQCVYTVQHFLNNHFYKMNYPTLAATTLVVIITFSLLTTLIFHFFERPEET